MKPLTNIVSGKHTMRQFFEVQRLKVELSREFYRYLLQDESIRRMGLFTNTREL